MSLFAKLAAPSGRQRSTDLPLHAGPGTWTCALVRLDTSEFCVSISGPHPLTQSKLSMGTLCRVSFGIDMTKSFLISANEESVKAGGTTCSQLIISNKISDVLGIPKDVKEVLIADVSDTSPLILSELVLSIKDRYVSKRDLWMFQIRLLGTVVYLGQSPPFQHLLRCASVRVEDLVGSDNRSKVVHGVVGPQTRVIVRSDSAQICLILNVTRELWSFDRATHKPVFSKALEFLFGGIEEAIRQRKSHYFLIVLSGRLVHATQASLDLFDVVYEGKIDEVSWKKLRSDFVRFFNSYPSAVGWTENPFFTNEKLEGPASPWFVSARASEASFVRDTALCGCDTSRDNFRLEEYRPSEAVRSNLLESVNMCISHFSKHHLDRKLAVTGTQITLISANSGILHLTDPLLAEISRRRIQASACDIKVVSIGSKPLVDRETLLFIGNDKEGLACPWLPMHHYFKSVFSIIPLIDVPRSLFKPAMMCFSLVPRDTLQPVPFRKLEGRKKLSHSELIEVGVVSPKLQRVAVEANLRSSDAKPIDNWIVQGEGVRTLHDLIGIRLSLDMQLVDISASETDRATTPPPPPVLLAPKSESDSSSAAAAFISANAFGVKVNRSSMRDSHIQKVLLKDGEEKNSMWMLNRMESGNVYVSKVSLGSPLAEQIAPFLSLDYTFLLRRLVPVSPIQTEAIACKNCQSIEPFESLEIRKFSTAYPLPWNVLDELVSNPYAQQTLPSTVPYNANPIPAELEGFRWRLRSSIRTALFCLIDADLSHTLPSGNANQIALGQDVLPACAGNGSEVSMKFLNWLCRAESILKIQTAFKVNVIHEKAKRTNPGFVPLMVTRNGDWFQVQHEQQIQVPRPFIFSIEWILCNSEIIESTIADFSAAAAESGLKLLQLPHAQLFPPPAPDGESVEELAFSSKISINLPERTKAGFHSLLLSRLMDEKLGMILLFSCSADSVTEGIVNFSKNKKLFFSREPGWILMTKDARFFVHIKSKRLDWFANHTLAPFVGSGADPFLLFKQAVHTSLIDS